MSVLMTLRVKADPKAVEATPDEVLQGVVERAKAMGATQHHFYGSDTGGPRHRRVARRADLPEVLRVRARGRGADAACRRRQPEISFWHHLDVKDDIG